MIRSVGALGLGAALVLVASGCAQGSSPQTSTGGSSATAASVSPSVVPTVPKSSASLTAAPSPTIPSPPTPVPPTVSPTYPSPACASGSSAHNCEIVPSWSGYSASPSDATVWPGDISANWTVPAVACPPLATAKPRTAVWVGLWGGVPQMQDATAWVPQIGTASDCNNLQYGPGATYHVVWEMYAMPADNGHPNYGNGVQYDLKCKASDPYYNVCARHYASGSIGGTPIHTMMISAGDQINAAVALLATSTADPTKPRPRSFEIRLTDLNTGDEVQGNITTNQPVTLAQTDAQGGVIVENQPPCGVLDVLHLRCGLAFNGLAQFPTPINVTGMTLLTYSHTAKLNYTEWVMQRDYTLVKSLLAQNSDPTGSAEGTAHGLSFTVTWLRAF